MSLDDLQAQLRGTLDQQFAALKKKYDDGVAEARQQAAAEAEHEFAGRLAAAQREWDAQRDALVAAARSEGQRQAEATLQREREAHAQLQAQAVTEAVNTVRAESAAQSAGALERQRQAHEQALSQAVTDAVNAVRMDSAQQSAVALERQRQTHEQALNQALAQAAEVARTEAAQQTTAAIELQRQAHEQALARAAEAARAQAAEQTAAALEAHRQAHEQALAQAIAKTTEAVRVDAAEQAAATIERQRQAHEQALAQAVSQAADAARGESAQHAADALERQRQAQEQSLEQAVARAADAARADVTQQMTGVLERERQAHEHATSEAVAQAVAAVRRSAELELESERRRGQSELAAARDQAVKDAEAAWTERLSGADAARAQAVADAETARQRAQADLDALQQRMQAERAATTTGEGPKTPSAPSPAVPGATFERIMAGVRELDAAPTLSQALASLLAHAGAAAGRTALFLIDGDRLKAWKALGIPEVDFHTVESSIGGRDLLARAIQTGQATSSSAELPAPPFARLPPDRAGLAVPLLVGGRAVAVLYADSAPNTPRPGSVEAVEALVRHASAIVALRTATRTLAMLGGTNEADVAHDVSDDQGARRYARLLVSEIKLYNEPAVRAGREQRDLLHRLRVEIDRAQRMYEARVPPAIGGRQTFFQQELVQTLADGDPALLGSA